MTRQMKCLPWVLQFRALEGDMPESGLSTFVFFVVMEHDCKTEYAGVKIDE